MFDGGVDTASVTATVHRTHEHVPGTRTAVVVAQLLDRVPAVGATAVRVAAHRPVLPRGHRTVLAPMVHGSHQPIVGQVRARGEPLAALAPAPVVSARTARQVRHQAQAVRRQTVVAAAVARGQLPDLRAQELHPRR